MLIPTTLRSTFIKFHQETVKYKSYKNLSETLFFYGLDKKLLQKDSYCYDDLCLEFTEIFSSVLDKHTPSKYK